MAEPLADPQLVRRIRELVADPEGASRSAHSDPAAGWVPAPPSTPAGAPGWVPPAPGTPAADPGSTPAGLTGDRGQPRVLTLPRFLRGSRVGVQRKALIGLVAVTLVAGLVFAVRVAAASARGEPVAVDPNPSGRVSRSTPAGPSTAPTGTGAPASAPSRAGGESAPLHVHVVGQVAAPQVVTLPAGSRVADAVASAGGALASADLARVNLARVLADGEQVHVPAPGEAGAAAPVTSGSTATAGALVDLNSADLAALDSLPGVGPVLAQRIVDWRTAHGRFSTVEELGEVSGIGDKLLAQVRPRVTVGGPRR